MNLTKLKSVTVRGNKYLAISPTTSVSFTNYNTAKAIATRLAMLGYIVKVKTTWGEHDVRIIEKPPYQPSQPSKLSKKFIELDKLRNEHIETHNSAVAADLGNSNVAIEKFNKLIENGFLWYVNTDETNELQQYVDAWDGTDYSTNKSIIWS